MNAFLKLFVVTSTLVLLGGCAGNEPATPVCDSYDAVQNTVNHIRDANVSENGLAAVRPYVSQLLADLNQLVADAKSQFGPQADQLKLAVDHLSATVDTARQDPNVTNLAMVRDSVTSLRASAGTLRDVISGTC